MRARVLSRLLMAAFTSATLSALAALDADQAERGLHVDNRFLDKGCFVDAVKQE